MEESQQETGHMIRITETDIDRVALMAAAAGYGPDEYEIGVTNEHGGTEFIILPKNLPRAS